MELYSNTDRSEGCVMNWSAVCSENNEKNMFSSPVVNAILLAAYYIY